MPRSISKVAQTPVLLGTLRWSLPLFGLVIVAVMWAGFYLQLRADRERTEQEAFARARGSTQAYEAHLQRFFQQIDQLTAFVALNAETVGTPLDLNRLVRQTLSNQPALKSLYVVDAQGDVVAVSIDSAAPSAYGNAADRRYFQVHQEGHDRSLYVGEPIKGRVSNQWVIHLSRAWRRADGSFAGVVVATVDPAFLSNFYNEGQFGAQGIVSLVGLDRVVRSRRSGEKVGFGDHAGPNFLAQDFEKSSAGTLYADSGLDGVRRLVAYRVMSEYRLVACTGLARSEVFQAYEDRRDVLLRFFAVATAAILGASAVFSFLLQRMLRSRREADAAALRFLAASNAQLDAFFILTAQRAPDGHLQDFVCDHANRRAVQWLDLSLTEMLGKSVTPFLPKAQRARLFGAYCAVVETQEPLVEEFSLQRRERTLHVVQQVVPIGDGVAITMRDVTDIRRKEAEILASRAALAASESRIRAITNNLPVLISYMDRDLMIRFVNQTYEKWFGRAWQVSENTQLREHWDEDLYNKRIPYVMRALGGETVEFLAERETREGLRTFQNTYIPDADASGAVYGIYMMSTDVTELKQAEAGLQALLHTDTLTGLANRRSFNDRLPRAIARAQRNTKGMALFYVDVDRFKLINDTYGHGAGDTVLKEVAERLRRVIRLSDVVARLSGDEFVLILEDLSVSMETEFVARKLLKQFEAPIETDSGAIAVTISLGIAYDEQGVKDAETLLAEADRALYASKERGRNTFTSGTDTSLT